MWNYVDMVILGLFFMMLVLRCFTLNETDPYQSRLLQVVNILYGISTLLLTLRFSSILEVNKTVGPLQLALFRMCIDLLIILTQFSFVIMAFSAAITKVYVAEISFLTPAHQRESNETGRLEELNETGRTGGSVERVSYYRISFYQHVPSRPKELLSFFVKVYAFVFAHFLKQTES